MSMSLMMSRRTEGPQDEIDRPAGNQEQEHGFSDDFGGYIKYAPFPGRRDLVVPLLVESLCGLCVGDACQGQYIFA